MQRNDYRISTQLRGLLVQKWVDLSVLDFGVTNGVVYFTGELRHHLSRANQDKSEKIRSEEVELAAQLERLLRNIPGVRDAVFRLRNVVKRGSTWTHRME